MRFVFIFLFGCLSVFCADKHIKPLTESMGQEVIEINGPLKELPQIEEEPSAENEEDTVTATTNQVATAKEEVKKIAETVELDNSLKDIERSERQKDDEEARIEKELADIYKDTLDYKADSAEVTKDAAKPNATEPSEKPIARARSNFKFQPDSNDPREIAIFRTSIDDIVCKKDKLSLTSVVTDAIPASGTTLSNLCLYTVTALLYIYTCNKVFQY